MSGSGSPAPQGNGSTTGEFASSLPETLRGNSAFADIKDVGTLAQRYADTQKPFAERLPEKYRGEASLKDIKDMDGLVSGYLHAQKLVGADKNKILVLPKDDKDVEGWNTFYKSQGRPDDASKYVFGKRADGTDYGDPDKAFQKDIAPILHKMGVTQRQLDAGRADWDQLQAKISGAAETARKADLEGAQAKLREKWGGDYDGNLKNAEAAVLHYGQKLGLADQLKAELSVSQLGNNPALAQVFSLMGKQLKEDGLIGKDQGGFGDGMSREAARTKIAELEAAFRDNPKFKDKNADGRAEALAEITRFYAIAYPEEKEGAAA